MVLEIQQVWFDILRVAMSLFTRLCIINSYVTSEGSRAFQNNSKPFYFFSVLFCWWYEVRKLVYSRLNCDLRCWHHAFVALQLDSSSAYWLGISSLVNSHLSPCFTYSAVICHEWKYHHCNEEIHHQCSFGTHF